MDETPFHGGHRESAIEGNGRSAKHARFLAASDVVVCAQIGMCGNDSALLGVSDDGVFVRRELIG